MTASVDVRGVHSFTSTMLHHPDLAPSGGGAQADQDSRVVKLKGLPYNVSKQEIVEFFEDLEVLFVHFVYELDGRPSGLAFVEFKSRSVAAKALKKRGHYLHKRYIKVLQVSYDEMKEQVLLGTSAIPTSRYQSRPPGLSTPATSSTAQSQASRPWQPPPPNDDGPQAPTSAPPPPPNYASSPPPTSAPQAASSLKAPSPAALAGPPRRQGSGGVHQLIVNFDGDVVTTSTKSFRRLLACGSAVYVCGLQSHTNTIVQDVSQLFCSYRLDLPSMVYGVDPGGMPSGEVWLKFRSCQDALHAACELSGSLVRGSPISVLMITPNDARRW